MPQRMTTAYIGVGSNIDKHKHIEVAIQELGQIDPQLKLSSIYQCPAIGFAGESFFNLIVEMKTSFTLIELSNALRDIEYKYGRHVDAKKFQSRTLDLDIVLFGDECHAENPQVPREDIYKYPFVIEPLYELCPRLVVPNDGRTIHQIWQLAKHDTGMTVVVPWFSY
jgi:2-amino-4-hydroxy-6-hydroxymethyldihydropteridine diphosphokinase